MYVILGATGNIGGKIAAQLLKEGKQVRAVGRNAEKLASLSNAGAELAIGDIHDVAFLTKALTGAEAAFVMLPPKTNAEDVYAHQEELSESISAALKASGVKKVVALSSLGAHTTTDTGVVAGLARHEQRLNAQNADADIVFLRAAYFMENFLGFAGMIKYMGFAGSTIAPDVKLSLVATQDIAAVAVANLLNPSFTGHSVQPIHGPADLTMAEATAILAASINRPEVVYVQNTPEQQIGGMMQAGYSQSYAASLADLGLGANKGVFGQETRTAASTTPTTLADFVPLFAHVYGSM